MYNPVLRSIAALTTLCAVDPANACDSTGSEDCAAITLAATYTGELWQNLAGGIDRGSGYLDNLDLMASLDAGARWERWRGFTAHAHLIYNNGHSFGRSRVGEIQALSNIESVGTWRLYEFWFDYRFGTRRATSVRFGIYDYNVEFAALDAAGLFINSSHGIGPEAALTGHNGPSIFPVPGLALRVRGETANAYWQIAALDAVPGHPHYPDRTGLHLDGDEGALLAAEAGGAWLGFRKLALGAWRYTEPFAVIGAQDPQGNLVHDRGNQGAYLLAERPLWAGERGTVDGFLRLGAAAGRFNQLDRFVGAGVVWHDAFGRRNDQLGLSVAWANNGGPFRRLMALNGAPAERAETVFELTWRAPVAGWLTLQPTAQFVLNPGTDPSLADAFAVGLRFEVNTAWQH